MVTLCRLEKWLLRSVAQNTVTVVTLNFQKKRKQRKIFKHSNSLAVHADAQYVSVAVENVSFEDGKCMEEVWCMRLYYLTSGKVVLFLLFIPFAESIYSRAALCFRKQSSMFHPAANRIIKQA